MVFFVGWRNVTNLDLVWMVLRRRGPACSAASADRGPGQPGTDPIGVLIDLLTGVESAGREVAEYADRLRIAGAVCERAWDRFGDATQPRKGR